MNKAELIQSMANKSGLSNKEANNALDSFIVTIEEVLAAKDKITLLGFGSFQIVERAARIGRNPKTGEELKIPATTKAKFKAGKSLDEAVSNGKVTNKTETKAAVNKSAKTSDKANDKKLKTDNLAKARAIKDSKSTKNKK